MFSQYALDIAIPIDRVIQTPKHFGNFGSRHRSRIASTTIARAAMIECTQTFEQNH